jgi:hypothetical protein
MRPERADFDSQSHRDRGRMPARGGEAFQRRSLGGRLVEMEGWGSNSDAKRLMSSRVTSLSALLKRMPRTIEPLDHDLAPSSCAVEVILKLNYAEVDQKSAAHESGIGPQ